VIQAQALRIACGAMVSTPTNAIQVETGEQPLQLRRLEQQIKYGIKIKNIPNHPAQPVIQEDWRVFYGKFRLGSEPLVTKIQAFNATLRSIYYEAPRLPGIPPWLVKHPKVDTRLTSVINKKQSEVILKANASDKIDMYRDHLHIYTDGSKTDTGLVASSFCIPALDVHESARLNDNVTVYAAELTAIQLAINWLTDNQPVTQAENKVAIFSDSLSALLSIKTGYSKSRPNLLIHLSESISRVKYSVTMVWIPAHVGLKYNDVADKLAKEATFHTAVDININLELNDVYDIATDFCTKKWQQSWDASNKGRHFYSIVPSVTRKTITTHSSRAKEVALTRLRLGKCKLNHYLHKMNLHMNLHSDGLCKECKTPETIDHYLLQCEHGPVSRAIRQICFVQKIDPKLEHILNDQGVQNIIFHSLDRKL